MKPKIVLSLKVGTFESRAACKEGFEIYKNTDVVAHNVGDGYAINMRLRIDGDQIRLPQATMKAGDPELKIASVQEGKVFIIEYEDADGCKYASEIQVKRVRVPSSKGEMAALVHWETV
ncbi:MAG: hypothetical protein UY48_C0011G0027 [Candidatus Gottesmanbacteria bacterium GW2011_GWB1_49_7]|uniref:Uncharacterized protein n=1 Tax=Candidatus Gottesmanbacteria bacterium GW2011_GWB1_49_7 TaxID=1618448 RepID=A0A0G1W1X0_9BACT|nr:MAG: hypothetical protein UY48_C0011G0027 [Candidatus Gottesmanbacteria bacterium GW2011_GWB1_49_7]